MGLYIGGSAIGGMSGRLVSGLLADWLSWRVSLGVVGVTGLDMRHAVVAVPASVRAFCAAAVSSCPHWRRRCSCTCSEPGICRCCSPRAFCSWARSSPSTISSGSASWRRPFSLSQTQVGPDLRRLSRRRREQRVHGKPGAPAWAGGLVMAGNCRVDARRGGADPERLRARSSSPELTVLTAGFFRRPLGCEQLGRVSRKRSDGRRRLRCICSRIMRGPACWARRGEPPGRRMAGLGWLGSRGWRLAGHWGLPRCCPKVGSAGAVLPLTP